MTKKARFIVLCMLSFFLGLTHSLWVEQGRASPSVQYFEPFDLTSGQAKSLDQQPIPDGTFEVFFSAFGRQFSLELEPNNFFAANAQAVWIGKTTEQKDVPATLFYKGRIHGEENSWVRLMIRGGRIEGMLRTKDEVYFIEPGVDLLPQASPYMDVIYRMSDVLPSEHPGSCYLQPPPTGTRAAILGEADDPFRTYEGLVSELHTVAKAASLQQIEQIEIGAVADFRYYQRHGSDSITDMLSILNQVDGIFRNEVGVAFNVAEITAFTSSQDDPFNNTSDPGSLLTQFSQYKAKASSPVNGLGLAHLFTGRSLYGGVVGIAWLGALCSNYYGTGVSADYTNVNKELVILTAHEIGHNFNAPHDNQNGSPCKNTPFGYIMNPYVTSAISLAFSTCSEQQIAPEIATASCLFPLEEEPSCQVSLSPQSQSHSPQSESGSVGISAPSECNWTAQRNAAWITITQGANGSGNGVVEYTVAANSGAPRTATLTIANQTFTINQHGESACVSELKPVTRSHKTGGGKGQVSVRAECQWDAQSDAAWLSITQGTSGSGNGKVKYEVGVNDSGTSRTGSLAIGGRTFTVVQEACSYALRPVAGAIKASAGQSSVALQTQSQCPWTAQSNSPWLTIIQQASGSGNKRVKYAFTANTSPNPRTGSLTIGGQTFTVRQEGSN